MDPDPNFSWIDPDPKSRQTIKILFFFKPNIAYLFVKFKHISLEKLFFTPELYPLPIFFSRLNGQDFFLLAFFARKL